MHGNLSGDANRVRSIKYTYDNRGRLTYARSFDNTTGGGTKRNEVRFDYLHGGHVKNSWQSHEGSIVYSGGSATPKVVYADDFSDVSGVLRNAARVIQVTYPNGAKLEWLHGNTSVYGHSDNRDDRLSRVDATKFTPSGGSQQAVAAYQYNGTARLVDTEYDDASVGVNQPRFNVNSGGTNDYDSFDRFGQPIRHRWYDGSTMLDSDEPRYRFNGVKYRRFIESAVYSGGDKNQWYDNDGLQRLVEYRGGSGTGSSGPSTEEVEQEWTLDQLGNWTAFKQDDNGNGSWEVNQTRTHNDANELTTISTWTNVVQDAAGNQTTIPQPGSLSSAYTLKYDAWNRLVEVKDGSTVVQENEYDGLHRRIVRDETGGSGVLTHFYYGANWQVLEERVGTATTADKQYVYHPHYVDAIAMMRDSSGDEYYYLQDSNANVTALVDDTGDVIERYQYTPYGDVDILNGTFGARGSSTYDNELLYTGRRLDPETGLQHSRYRYYHQQLGRWVSRDPIGYWGGTNLYGYVDGLPTYYVDPYGLAKGVTPIDAIVGIWNDLGCMFGYCDDGRVSIPEAIDGVRDQTGPVGDAVLALCDVADTAVTLHEIKKDPSDWGNWLGFLPFVTSGMGRTLFDKLPSHPKKPTIANPKAPDPDATGPRNRSRVGAMFWKTDLDLSRRFLRQWLDERVETVY